MTTPKDLAHDWTPAELLALAREILPGCEWLFDADCVWLVAKPSPAGRENQWRLYLSRLDPVWVAPDDPDGRYDTPRAALEALRAELERRHTKLARVLAPRRCE